MNSEIYIGRQPILDVNQKLYGYELLFRSGNTAAANVTDDLSATSRVLVNTLNHFGVSRLLGDKKGFVNINEEVLTKELYKSLPKENFILEILETTKIDTKLNEKIEAMTKEGYIFALDDFVFSDEFIATFKQLFDKVSIIKVDVRLNKPETLFSKIKIFKSYNLRLLAEKVENMEEFYFYKKLGFDYFQGYFFEKPTVMKTRNIDPEKAAIMEVFNLIQQDTDINKIENTFKLYPELTVNLLRFINSAQIYLRNRVTSIKQAIALIGYRKLGQWLLLMAYATPGMANKANPLFHTASQRGKAMELLTKAVNPAASQVDMDEAFLAGLLSLMGALLSAPIEEVLAEMNVGDNITAAIIRSEGRVGELLRLVSMTEDSNLDMEKITAQLKTLNLDMEKLRTALMDSFLWVESMSDEQ